MDVAKSFDKLADKYYATYGTNPEYNYFIERIVDFVKRGKVLDLGCGAGIPVTQKLVKHGYEVTGVDVSRKMIDEAKKNVKGAHFINEDIRKTKLTTESFDGVCALFSLGYLTKDDAKKVIDKMHEALCDNGFLLIGVLEGTEGGEITILGEKVETSVYSEDELRELLKKFKVMFIEHREFKYQEDELQKQIFLLAKKTPPEIEPLGSEDPLGLLKSESEEKTESSGKHKDKSNKKDKDGEQKSKKTKKKEDYDEGDKPLIKITLFGSK